MNEADNDNKEAISPNVSSQPPNNETFEPLFSEEEIRNIVKSFIVAWLSNEVKLAFPSKDSYKQTVKMGGGKISDSYAHQLAMEVKTDLADLISVCAGRTTATPSQRRKAMYDIFYDLLAFRSGNRIEGHFMYNATEGRLSSIEENISELNKHFEELYFYVRTRLPDDTSPKSG